MNENKIKYVLLLDYVGGTLIKIKLTDVELKESENYEDFDEFLNTLEDKYTFRLKDCEWMTVNELTEREYGF